MYSPAVQAAAHITKSTFCGTKGLPGGPFFGQASTVQPKKKRGRSAGSSTLKLAENEPRDEDSEFV